MKSMREHAVKSKMQKYISLVVGIFGMWLTGVLYSFNTYALALKNTFNYTQSNVEFIAASGDLGQSIMFPVGLIFDKFGPRPTCTFGLILTGVGFTLLWMSTMFKTYFAHNAWLFCVIYSVAMFGTAFPNIASLAVNSKNFEGKHRATVLVVLGCIYGISPTIFSTIYQGFFVQGHVKDAENQKYGDFMLFLAVISVVINLLAIALLKEIPGNETIQTEGTELNELFKTLEKNKEDDDKTDDDKYVDDKTTLIPEAAGRKNATSLRDLNSWQIIQTLQFHYFFLICIILGGTGGTFVNNIAIVLRSAHREHDVAIFTICLPIFSSLGRICIGLGFGYIFQRWNNIPKSSGLLPCSIIMCISLIVMISFYHSFIGLFSSTIMMSFAYGAFFLQVQCVNIELFGLKYVGQNLGIFFLGHGIGMFGFHQLFGFSYKLNSPLGSNECYGESCSKRTFLLLMILCFCALFLNILLVKIERDAKMKQKET